MNILETRERFPSGSYTAVDFPPKPQRGRIVKIDADCLGLANAIIAQYRAGTLSEDDARGAIYALEFGRPDAVNVDEVQSKKPHVIVCSVCGKGPMAEDGGVALFADGSDAAGRPRRFCAAHLPLDAVRRRLGRQDRPPLEAAISAIFQRRLAKEPGQ